MIKSLVQRLIPFYLSYKRSVSTPIHNQSYWGYVRFRLTGKCNGGDCPKSS